MLTGAKLGLLKGLLKARRDAVDAFLKMEKCVAFCQPMPYNQLKVSDFDAILLSGGHDKGVREYLESEILQNLVVEFFNHKKPVGAICHGVVLAARSIDPATKNPSFST